MRKVLLIFAVALLFASFVSAEDVQFLLVEDGYLFSVDGKDVFSASFAGFSDFDRTVLIGESVELYVDISIIDKDYFVGLDKVFLVDTTNRDFNLFDQTCSDLTECSNSRNFVFDEEGVKEMLFLVVMEKKPEYYDIDLSSDFRDVSALDSGQELIVSKPFSVRVLSSYSIARENLGSVNELPQNDQIIFIDRFERNVNQRQSLLSKAETASKYLTVETPAPVVADGKSTFRIHIGLREGVSSVQQVQVYELIPKSIAEDVDELLFEGMAFNDYSEWFQANHPGAFVEVLEKDPLIVWHFSEVEEDVELSYEVDFELDRAEVGNTFVTAQGISSNGVNYNYWWGLLIIPVVVFVIVYFNRFKKEPKKQGELPSEDEYLEQAKLPTNIEHLENYVRDMISKGHAHHHIKKKLLEHDWNEELIDSTLLKLGKE
ncbi:hypothetical protein JW868_03430 [Candidatus Woesearchaeota archaeon]|nr:hypothetical protein [Candidatus Woesearchaeota archaeon]